MLGRGMRRTDGGLREYGGVPPAGYTPNPGFGPPGGGFVPPGGPMTPGSGREVNVALPLAIAIGSTLLCLNPVLGLPAVVLAIQARNARDVGELDTAASRAKAATVVGAVGMGIGLLFESYELYRFMNT
jgi:hypothetical protein